MHARLPALSLLVVVSIFAAAILLFNIRRQGWTLPVLAVGHLGLRGPRRRRHLPGAAADAEGHPGPVLARSALHHSATSRRRGPPTTSTMSRSSRSTPRPVSRRRTVAQSAATLNNIRLWDPDQSITLQTFQRQQAIKSYYTFQSLGVDRYTVDGQVTPGPHRRPRHLPGQPALAVVGQPAPAVHPWRRGGGRAGQPGAVQRQPRLRDQGRAADLVERLPKITQPNVYFAIGRHRLRGGRHQAARGELPDGQRHECREPLRRARAACSCRRCSSGPRSPCAWATSTF